MEFHSSMEWEGDTRLKRLPLLLLNCVHSSAVEGMFIGAAPHRTLTVFDFHRGELPSRVTDFTCFFVFLFSVRPHLVSIATAVGLHCERKDVIKGNEGQKSQLLM